MQHEEPSSKKMRRSALTFEVLGTWNNARVSKLTLPHYECDTPMFMPVGTQGTVKGLTSQDLEELDCHLILGNTYHLGLRPSTELLDDMGGLHKYMNWKRAMLTDSGGFQMVSLLKLACITEEGVTFQSPVDGSPMLLTPERSIEMQNQIGADIMMALDDVVSSTTTGPRVEEACHRTLRWIDRCISAHKRENEQNLFGIVQGGLDPVLRDICLTGMKERDLPGYAIGGLSGGEEKDVFWRIVHQCCQSLPPNKPRYLMGVGYAVDLVVCSALGVDMFDCVYPARTARFGVALVPSGTMQLRGAQYANDFRPIDETCTCMVCKKYTRAFLRTLVTREAAGARLLTYHNIAYQMRLMRELRESILANRFPAFVLGFMNDQYPAGNYPKWAWDALHTAGVTLPDPQPDPPPEPAPPKNRSRVHVPRPGQSEKKAMKAALRKAAIAEKRAAKRAAGEGDGGSALEGGDRRPEESGDRGPEENGDRLDGGGDCGGGDGGDGGGDPR